MTTRIAPVQETGSRVPKRDARHPGRDRPSGRRPRISPAPAAGAFLSLAIAAVSVIPAVSALDSCAAGGGRVLVERAIPASAPVLADIDLRACPLLAATLTEKLLREGGQAGSGNAAGGQEAEKFMKGFVRARFAASPARPSGGWTCLALLGTYDDFGLGIALSRSGAKRDKGGWHEIDMNGKEWILVRGADGILLALGMDPAELVELASGRLTSPPPPLEPAGHGLVARLADPLTLLPSGIIDLDGSLPLKGAALVADETGGTEEAWMRFRFGDATEAGEYLLATRILSSAIALGLGSPLPARPTLEGENVKTGPYRFTPGALANFLSLAWRRPEVDAATR